MASHPNGHKTITYDELIEAHGHTRKQWATWFWEAVEERGYAFLIGSSTRNSGSCGQNLHLPTEWPDEEFTAEPYSTISGDRTICRNAPVTCWRVKPVNVYPVDYKEVCDYCLYDFEQWWLRNHPASPEPNFR